MTKFESSVKQIPHSQQCVYNTLSDLNNVQRLKERLPEGSTGNDDMDKVKERLQNLTFDQDSLSVNVDPVGQISMRIIEREEPKTIKFESANSPLSFNFWLHDLDSLHLLGRPIETAPCGSDTKRFDPSRDEVHDHPESSV